MNTEEVYDHEAVLLDLRGRIVAALRGCSSDFEVMNREAETSETAIVIYDGRSEQEFELDFT